MRARKTAKFCFSKLWADLSGNSRPKLLSVCVWREIFLITTSKRQGFLIFSIRVSHIFCSIFSCFRVQVKSAIKFLTSSDFRGKKRGCNNALIGRNSTEIRVGKKYHEACGVSESWRQRRSGALDSVKRKCGHCLAKIDEKCSKTKSLMEWWLFIVQWSSCAISWKPAWDFVQRLKISSQVDFLSFPCVPLARVVIVLAGLLELVKGDIINCYQLCSFSVLSLLETLSVHYFNRCCRVQDTFCSFNCWLSADMDKDYTRKRYQHSNGFNFNLGEIRLALNAEWIDKVACLKWTI